MGNKTSMNRWGFLKYSAFGAMGASIPSQGNLSQSKKQAESKSPRIKNYRPLGRTGFKVSDISSGMPFNPAILKADLAEEFVKKYKLENAAEIKSAAIRFCLSNPNVNTACISFQNFDDVKNNIPLSGGRLAQKDKALLAAYRQGLGSLYCRHSCGLCEPECPHKVPVNTIMRYNHYFAAQGREKFAMEKYTELPTAKADLCSTCEGFCEAGCPYGIPIHGLLTLAHQNLTLA